MTPQDQIDRDWTKGNCFYITLEFIKDSEGLRDAGSIPSNADVRLVHGLLDANFKRVKHAWVEIDDHVLDHANNQNIYARVEDYYRDNNALAVKKFTRAEADALLSALSAEDGSLPIAYWGDLSDDAVSSAADSYKETNGVFSSDISFSDPNDYSNADNLKIKGEQGGGGNSAALRAHKINTTP